ncbi:glutathione S-transferase [Dendrothele bispora CBS 962.96]|uniref:glutathione transferase n=1 Tax=Dendrothele bispora (strain CBS 962.96) TaxID=1314807 RepID=A0A4S8LPP1_DENBC|nr:glutathione S-transferase [Dendrothele bispora CBS 962.96]
MVLKFYASPLATCGRRVATVLWEKKIPYEFIDVDVFNGEHKTPAYLEKHPFGQIPYIEDDGFILYESRAICRYLEAKYPNKDLKLAPSPSDVKASALFEQAASVEQNNFEPHASKAAYESVLKPLFRKEPKDEATYNAAIKALSDKLDGYERILSKQKYLAGDEITLVDLFHIVYGAMLEQGGSDLMTSKGPNVARWWKDISSRASWQAVKDGIPTGSVTFD